MALAVVGEAAVGAVVGELLRAVLELKEKPTTFRSTLEILQSTLETISPVIEEIEYQNYALGRPKSEIERLIKGLKDGKKLICKCSRVRRWDYLKQMRYQKRLVAFDEWLTRFLKVEMQALMARDQRETLLAVKQVFMRLQLPLNQYGCANFTMGVRCSQFGGKEVEATTLEFYMRIELKKAYRFIQELNRQFQGLMGENEESIDANKSQIFVSGMFDSSNLVDISSRTKRKVELLNHETERQEKANEAQEAKEKMEAREEDRRISLKQYTQTERMTIGGGIEDLNSTLQSSSSSSGFAALKFQNKLCYCGRKAAVWNPDSERNNRSYCYCVANNSDSSNFDDEGKEEMEEREEDQRLLMSPFSSWSWSSSSSSSSSSGWGLSSHGLATLKFQNKLCHCRRKAALWISNRNSCSFYYCEKYYCGYYESYVPMENETSAGREVVSHSDSVNFDNKRIVNEDFEEMSRKCGSLMQHLQVLQGAVSGLKLLSVTSVMVCLLSLIIMNFVILMYN